MRQSRSQQTTSATSALAEPKSDTDTITVTSEAVPAFAASPTHPTLPSALDTSLDNDGKQKFFP